MNAAPDGASVTAVSAPVDVDDLPIGCRRALQALSLPDPGPTPIMLDSPAAALGRRMDVSTARAGELLRQLHGLGLIYVESIKGMVTVWDTAHAERWLTDEGRRAVRHAGGTTRE